MNLIAAIAAGVGTSFVVSIPVAVLTGLTLAALKLEHYAVSAAVIIQVSAIGVGILVSRIVYRRLKQRSAPAH